VNRGKSRLAPKARLWVLNTFGFRGCRDDVGNGLLNLVSMLAN